MRRVFSLFTLIAVLFSFVGCRNKNNVFEFAEFTITLPGEYEQLPENDVYDLTVSNGSATLGLNRIPRYLLTSKDDIKDWFDPIQLAEHYLIEMGLAERGDRETIDKKIENLGDVPYYIYYDTPEESKTKMFCLIAFYRSPYAFFTLMCYVDADAEGAYIGDFIDYIDNVIFKKSPDA